MTEKDGRWNGLIDVCYRCTEYGDTIVTESFYNRITEVVFKLEFLQRYDKIL